MEEKKYKDLLGKYYTPEQQQEIKNVPTEKGKDVSNESPGDVKNSYTPDPRDAGKQNKAGQKATVEEAGKTLQENGVEPVEPPTESNRSFKDMLSDYMKSNSDCDVKPQQEQNLDFDR